MSDIPSQHIPSGDGKTGQRPGRARGLAAYGERPSLTQKSRRLGERVIETGIYVIATFSIVSIFLIFIFVFREASPIFLGGSSSSDTTIAASYDLPQGVDTAASATPVASTDTGDIIQYNANVPDIPSSPGAGDSAGSPTTASSGAANDSDIIQYNPTPDIPLNGSTGSGTTAGPGGAGTTPEPVRTQTQKDSMAREIIGKDYPILSHDSPVKFSYTLYDNWQPNSEHPRYGIYPIIVGTLKTTLIALLVAAPLGILAALYTAFFAPKRLREIIKPTVELLAGFPSVVLGFFCLMTVASIVQGIFGVEYRLNSVVGGIGLALAVIPIIFTLTDDALRAVPQSLREAALALGATEWEAAYKVMLPAATPGIFAALLLGLGRAFGETMIALMATGNAGTFNWDFFEPVRTFAATIGAEMGEVVFGSPHYQMLFFLGVILFIFSFLINLVTEFYVKDKLIKRFRGAE